MAVNINEYMISPFKVGDIVRLKDGDGRPHEIERIDVEFFFNMKHFVYIFKDGGISYDDYNLQKL